LYKLELEYKRTLEGWNRRKARRAAPKTPFRPAHLPSPEELPIQGLMMPEPPKRRHDGVEDRRKRRFRRSVKLNKTPRKFGGSNRDRALKTESRAISFLCRCCDYRDRLTGKCLILRLGGECPYMNGIYFCMPKKPIKISVRRQ